MSPHDVPDDFPDWWGCRCYRCVFMWKTRPELFAFVAPAEETL